MLLSKSDVQIQCVLLYYVSVSEGAFALKGLFSEFIEPSGDKKVGPNE